MSIFGWCVKAKSYIKDDYEFVNIATTWKGIILPQKPLENKKVEVMWSHESLYGIIGSKVGDFIQVFGINASLQEGIFTHRNIAQNLVASFTGLKINEVFWLENPLENYLNNGKSRKKRAKWLPEKEVDLVHLYSDNYVNAKQPKSITTDFYTVIRNNNSYESNWFMYTEAAKVNLEKMKFKNLKISYSEIK